MVSDYPLPVQRQAPAVVGEIGEEMSGEQMSYIDWIMDPDNWKTLAIGIIVVVVLVYLVLFAKSPRSHYWLTILLISFLALNLVLFGDVTSPMVPIFILSAIAILIYVAQLLFTFVEDSRAELERAADDKATPECASTLKQLIRDDTVYTKMKYVSEILSEALWYWCVPLLVYTFTTMYFFSKFRLFRGLRYGRRLFKADKDTFEKKIDRMEKALKGGKQQPQQQPQRQFPRFQYPGMQPPKPFWR